MIEPEKNKLRYNILNLFIYIVGIVLILRLFDFQIIHGEEYRQLSNNRLTREIKVNPARGNILDRTGNVLVGNTMGFELQLYKSKIETEELNNTILKIINIIERNGDTYTDTFPIKMNPTIEYTYTGDTLKTWKNENKIGEDVEAKDALYIFKEKYKINSENIEDIRKIIAIRYRIQTENYSSTNPIIISKNISRQTFLEIDERRNELPGVDVVTQSVRDYKNGKLASHIIGYMGRISKEEYSARPDYGMNDYIGKLGIEYICEDYLRGKPGTKQVDMDVDGKAVAEYDTKEAVQGSNVVLTIDANLQKVTEDALAKNLEKIRNGSFGQKCNATRGAVVVTNVKTGEILSMVSLPDYEPQLFLNGISEEKWAEYRENNALYNVAAQGSYAPGSTFKMITAIAGLETGTITRKELINDVGVYPYGHHPECWYRAGHGPIDVVNAIQKSCNYFFYEIGYRMGVEPLEKYARYFGLGEKTGAEVLEETAGTLAGKTYYDKIGETWYLGNTLSAVIGQAENSFSPLQMAKYISVLTNGGQNIDLTLIKTIINQDGTEVSREEINNYVDGKISRTRTNKQDLNIDSENLKAILEGMRSVANDPGGTAYDTFKNFEIEIGGKTGSAEAGNKSNGWFVGFAPFDEPEIAIVVFVEGGEHGSYTAEVAKDIISEYFGMNQAKVEENNTINNYTQTIQ